MDASDWIAAASLAVALWAFFRATRAKNLAEKHEKPNLDVKCTLKDAHDGYVELTCTAINYSSLPDAIVKLELTWQKDSGVRNGEWQSLLIFNHPGQSIAADSLAQEKSLHSLPVNVSALSTVSFTCRTFATFENVVQGSLGAEFATNPWRVTVTPLRGEVFHRTAKLTLMA